MRSTTMIKMRWTENEDSRDFLVVVWVWENRERRRKICRLQRKTFSVFFLIFSCRLLFSHFSSSFSHRAQKHRQQPLEQKSNVSLRMFQLYLRVLFLFYSSTLTSSLLVSCILIILMIFKYYSKQANHFTTLFEHFVLDDMKTNFILVICFYSNITKENWKLII